MRRGRWWVTIAGVAALSALSLAAGCSSASDKSPTLTTSTTVPAPAPNVTDGALEGIRGTRPADTISDDFLRRVQAEAPEALDRIDDVVAAYDATIITALATVKSATDAPARIASNVLDVTTGRNRCPGFQRCRMLIDAGDEVAYVGPAGDRQLTEQGVPRAARIETVAFDDLDALRQIRATRVTMSADDNSATPSSAVFRPPDGTLTIGTLLPVIGPRAAQGRAQLAGVKLAVDDIDNGFGVLGRRVKVTDDNARGGSPQDVAGAVQRMAADGVDVVIGSTDSTMTAAAMPWIRGAGLMLFSASDGGTAELPGETPPEQRWLYFTAHPLARPQAEAIARTTATDGAPAVVVVRDEGGEGAELARSLAAYVGFAEGRRFGDAVADGPNAAVPLAVLGAPDALVVVGTDSFVVAVIKAVKADPGLAKVKIYVADVSVGLANAWSS